MTARAPARRAVDNRPYRLISGLPRTARRAAAKRDAIPCDNHTDAVSIIRHGTAVSTPQETIACPKARQNRRLHRYVDPIARGGTKVPERAQALFLFRRARRILFLGKTKRGPRRAPRGGERRSKGAGAVFAAGGNRAERTLQQRQWGAHPCGNSRLAGARPPRPPDGGPRLSEGTPFTSPFPPESGAPYSKRCIFSSEIALLICDTASSSRTVPHS